MKKLAFLLFTIILSTAISKAQIFVGGSFGITATGGSFDNGTTKTDKTSVTNINFTPKGGYMLSEKLWIGMQLGIGYEKEKDPVLDVTDKTTQIGITPFARYYVLKFNKLGLAVQSDLGFNFSTSKTEAGGTTVDGPKGTNISISIFPGLSYELNDRILLETYINGLNIGYEYDSEKEDVAGTETKDVTTNFNFGGNLDNILTSGFVTIGAIIML